MQKKKRIISLILFVVFILILLCEFQYIHCSHKTEEEANIENNKMLFELPPYDFQEKVDGYIIPEKYSAIQDGMRNFMSQNNMVGSVFAYRPSDGDVYCMISIPQSVETDSLKPNSMVKPITLLIFKDTIIRTFDDGNLMISPIDMAALTALWGKLSGDINSKVYFPRIWLPVGETKQNEGLPELLLTEKNFTKNEHVIKLIDFVVTHKEAIAERGKKFRQYKKYQLIDLESSLTNRSPLIDLVNFETGIKLLDVTNPAYQECLNKSGDDKKICLEKNMEKYSTRIQGNLSFYSEELDLAAYIVIENYSGVSTGSSKVNLGSTSLKLIELVAEALGKTLDPEKRKIEAEQLRRFEGKHDHEVKQNQNQLKSEDNPKNNTNNKKQQPKNKKSKKKKIP